MGDFTGQVEGHPQWRGKHFELHRENDLTAANKVEDPWEELSGVLETKTNEIKVFTLFN